MNRSFGNDHAGSKFLEFHLLVTSNSSPKPVSKFNLVNKHSLSLSNAPIPAMIPINKSATRWSFPLKNDGLLYFITPIVLSVPSHWSSISYQVKLSCTSKSDEQKEILLLILSLKEARKDLSEDTFASSWSGRVWPQRTKDPNDRGKSVSNNENPVNIQINF